MLDRIKQMAEEAGLIGSEVWQTKDGDLSVGGCEEDQLNESMMRFAQLVAEDCVSLCKQADAADPKASTPFDCIQLVRARYGIKE